MIWSGPGWTIRFQTRRNEQPKSSTWKLIHGVVNRIESNGIESGLVPSSMYKYGVHTPCIVPIIQSGHTLDIHPNMTGHPYLTQRPPGYSTRRAPYASFTFDGWADIIVHPPPPHSSSCVDHVLLTQPSMLFFSSSSFCFTFVHRHNPQPWMRSKAKQNSFGQSSLHHGKAFRSSRTLPVHISFISLITAFHLGGRLCGNF
jgi:hypothetical protein